MKNDIDRLYLIDRYLKGELTGPALDEFRTKMRLEPDFVKEIESQKAIIEGIKLARRQHLIALLKGESQPFSLFGDAKTESDKKEVDNESFENTFKETKPAEKLLVDDDIPKEKNVFEVIGQKVDIDDNEERNNYKSEPEGRIRLKVNYNNWYYAAAAVLFAGFFLYFLFGYYLPRQQGLMVLQQDTLSAAPSVAVEPEPLNPGTNDTSDMTVSSGDSVDIAMDGDPGSTVPTDSLRIDQDLKIDQNSYLVPGFETLSKNGTGNGNNNVSSGDPVGTPKVKSVIKVAGSLVKIEYWESAVGFKGYKLQKDRLLLFNIDPADKISLTYLDNVLYMKRAGVYYKMRSSGKFEQYTKETNQEIIKTLQAN